jgi:hypothetical protein
MKWAIAAIALVAVANGFVLVSAGRERAGPATLTPIEVCAGQLVGGGTSDEAPALELSLARDSVTTPPGLDAAGLRALGEDEAMITAMGRVRDSTFRWPRTRPAWVRLRQRPDSLEQWAVVAVAPRRELLAPDSASIVIRGRVGVREFRSGPVPEGMAGHQHRPMGGDSRPRVIYPAVVEVIPFQLHLDRQQIATLRAALTDTTGCAVTKQAVIANGATGGIWVEAVR